MRRQTPIAHLLYAYLYPQPKPEDPPSFSAHLARFLVPEVRIEVATFYGDLSTVESRYPGLNYCHPPHRMRLGRFPHHRKLFQAFSAIGLTEHEIQDFCCWEGTKWARERYEKDEGIKVTDTTGDEIGPWVDRRTKENARRPSITRKTDIEVVVEDSINLEDEDMSDADEEEEEDDEMEQEGGAHSLPQHTASSDGRSIVQQAAEADVELNLARQREQATRMNINQHVIAAWEQGTPLDPAFEQFLKEQSERHGLGVEFALLDSSRQTAVGPAPSSTSAASSTPSSATPRAAT